MITWLKRAIFGRPSVPPEAAARAEVRFELPDGFLPIEPPAARAKPHYEPPIVRAFQSSDKAVNVHVVTEHDHDGLDYHRKDAKRMVSEAGGAAIYMHHLEDGYTMGASMGPESNLHRRVRVFDVPNGATIIGTVDIHFQDKDDPRAVDLIRSAQDRLSLAEC